jgi:aryl-alcohol dehydrogenase-like predicted oxidoreductase
MRTRRLGNTDLHLTCIGLGTWAIGGPWDFGWGPQTQEDSVATIHRALDLGINWIDTAPAYGLGHAETMVGRAVKSRRGEVIVATKCGLVWDDPNKRRVTRRLKAQSVRGEAEASLRRLGVEAIDLYQIHWPNPDRDIEEAWEAIDDLIREGKVRYAGVSNFSVEQIRRLEPIRTPASVQPPYHLLDRASEKEILPYCAEHGMGVVTYGPMAYGLLTGKFSHASLAALPADDWRRKGGRFQEPELSANLALVDQLRPLAEGHARPLAHLAIAWVLRRPEVNAAIVGARRPDQIEQTAAAADWKLPQQDAEAIENLLAERDRALTDFVPASPV